MSFDSDFFIYDLHYGYIPINYFDTDVLEDDETGRLYMLARIYRLDNFLNYFNSNLADATNGIIKLRKEMLAVFAVLNGNDYVDSFDVFGSFLQTLHSANNNLSMRTAKQRGIRFRRILDWLTQFVTLEECVDVLVKVCKADLADKIRSVVDESVQEYMLKRKCSLLDHINLIK